MVFGCWTHLFGNISAFEFLRYWTSETLGPPSSSDAKPRTQWTQAGRELLGTQSLTNGTAKICPGLHYEVLEEQNEDDEYWVFPRDPPSIYGILRHSWVIVRRKRPYVPVLQGVKVPNASTSRSDSAKYLSLCFSGLGRFVLIGHMREKQ